MADAPQTGATGTPSPTPDNNIKAEFDRKLTNTEGKLAELEKQNKTLTSQLAALIQAVQAPAASAKDEPVDMSKLIYDDPDKFAEVIVEKVTSMVDRKQEQTMQQSRTIAELVNNYPELGNQESELTKKALEVYNSLSDTDRANPLSYKFAVSQAAQELDIKPKSKRPATDDFVMGGSSGGSYGRAPKERDVPPSVMDTARLFGLNVDDPKVKERLKKYSQYDAAEWLKYK